MKAKREHLELWERQQGHKYDWVRQEVKVDRNLVQNWRVNVEGFRCYWEGCGKICKSRAGLVVHQKRMHRLAEDRVRFNCDRCGTGLETEGARKNHMETCGGGVEMEGNRRECHKCRRGISKGNYATHVRSCRVVWDPGGQEGQVEGNNGRGEIDVGEELGRTFRTRRVICNFCLREQSAANLARHQRGCGGREPEGDRVPDGDARL